MEPCDMLAGWQEEVKRVKSKKSAMPKYPEDCFRYFPVAFEPRKKIPEQSLRNAQEQVHRSKILTEDHKLLIDACISYVCVNAPRKL